MKKLLLLLFIISYSISALCQDVIYKNDGTEINAKVIEITTNAIKYKKYEQQEGPIRNLSIDKIFMVIYEDGTKEVFKKKSITKTIEPQQKTDLQKNQVENISISEPEQTYTDNFSEKDAGSSDAESNFGIKAGFFMPANDAMKDIYGNGINYGIDINFWSENGLGCGIGVEYFNKKGEPYLFTSGGMQINNAECEISIIPIYLTGEYRIANNKKVIPYFGIGLGIFFIKENMNMDYTDPYGSIEHYSNQASSKAFSLHALAGIDIKPIYFEIKYSYATFNAEGAGGENCNLGGITISGGLKF